MNHPKALLALLPLLGSIMLGMFYESITSDAATNYLNNTQQRSDQPVFTNNDSQPAAKNKPLLVATSGDSTQENIPVEHSDNTAETLPGVFRGDWGETPVYATNDRVSYEGADYLGLLDENHNQPPSISPAYWRIVKKASEADRGNCLLPKSGAELGKCDFTGEKSLKDMDLHGANLSKAQINGELGFANLRGANLSDVTVIGALVISPDTQIDHANMSGLQSDGSNPVIAESANMNSVNFSNANLYGAKMKAANLTGAKMMGTTLTGADLRASHLEGADLSKTDMTYAKLSGSSLIGAALRQADLTEANLGNANFSEANLNEANLAGSNLAGTNLSGANLRGANLMDTKNVSFALIDSQTDFTSATCPDGVVVDGTQVITCVGHGF